MSGFFSSSRRIVCLAVLLAVSANAAAVAVIEPGDINLSEPDPDPRPFGTAEERVYVFQSVSVTGRTTTETPEWEVSTDPEYGEVGFILSGIETSTTATVSSTASSDTVIIRYRLVKNPFPAGFDEFGIVVAAEGKRVTAMFRVGIQNPPPVILGQAGLRLTPLDMQPGDPAPDPLIIPIVVGDTEARYTFYAGKERGGVQIGITPYFRWSVSTDDAGASVAFANGRQTTTGRGISDRVSGRPGAVLRSSPIEIVYSGNGRPISFDDESGFVVVVQDTLDRATTLDVSIEQVPPVITSPDGSALSFVSYELSPVVSFPLSADYLCPTSTPSCLVWDRPEGLPVRIDPEFSAGGEPVIVTATFEPAAGFIGETFAIRVTAAVDRGSSAEVEVEIIGQQNRPPTITGITDNTTRVELFQAQRTTVLTFTATDVDSVEAGRMISTLSWTLDTDSLTASTAVFVDADDQVLPEEQPPTGTTARVRFTHDVNTFTDGIATQTFTLTVSDSDANAQATVEMLILENTPPEILSIDGQEPPFDFDVASNLGITDSPPARFSAVARDREDFDTGIPLTWSVSSVQFSTGENNDNALGFVVDGQLEDVATGNNVMLELRRDGGETTVTFVLVVRDSLGAEGSSGEVKVTVGNSTPAINPGDLPPITAGESGIFTFSAEDEGLGQKEVLNWEVVAGSTVNLVVEFPSGNTGAEVEVTATLLGDVRTQLDGSFVLQVQNSVGSISTSRVTVSRSNEPPVVSYQSQDQSLTFQGIGDTTPVSIVLPFGVATTQIELSAVDPVGEPEGDSTFSWTFTGNPSDSTATFVGGPNETAASGSSVTVLFQVPEESGEDRSFTIQVSDGRAENAVSDIPVEVSRTTDQLFRVRMFLGGAAR